MSDVVEAEKKGRGLPMAKATDVKTVQELANKVFELSNKETSNSAKNKLKKISVMLNEMI